MVGIDIEQVDRFKNLDTHLKQRVYTKNEIEYCEKFENSSIHFAGIWCAKEAVVKCLSELNLVVSEIEILHQNNGAPYVNVTPKLQQYFDDKKFKNIHISISHINQNAIAIAMLEK
ncbi:MAG: holo-ACP synthase [Clostridia bacterium]|nr:holo-ACP synthase [Clostridia bacterium]